MGGQGTHSVFVKGESIKALNMRKHGVISNLIVVKNKGLELCEPF